MSCATEGSKALIRTQDILSEGGSEWAQQYGYDVGRPLRQKDQVPQAVPTPVTETRAWIKKFKGYRKPTNLNLFYRQGMASEDF